VTAVAAGADHTCAIAGGGLKCWGKNDQGQIGRTGGVSSSIPTPVDVEGLTSGVTLVGAGKAHTCAVHSGALTCWGANSAGQLGRGAPGTSSDVPTPVAGSLSGVTAVALGDQHSCALAAGVVSCWGANGRDQLGGLPAGATPAAVPGLGSGVTALASGLDHVCAIRGGDVLCWGSNSSGQLGRGALGGSSPVPTALGLTSVVALALGDAHSCALSQPASGAPVLFCWGANGDGQLGVSGSTVAAPTSVLLGSARPTLLTAGSAHTCIAQGDPGGMRCFGNDSLGQLGVASGSGPVPLPGLPFGVAAGGNHSCAVQTDGLLYCWGANDDGEVGNPTTCGSSCSSPTQPAGL
jgi:alpha-tubulin suppressor-like RCC1 family protein